MGCRFIAAPEVPSADADAGLPNWLSTNFVAVPAVGVILLLFTFQFPNVKVKTYVVAISPDRPNPVPVKLATPDTSSTLSVPTKRPPALTVTSTVPATEVTVVPPEFATRTIGWVLKGAPETGVSDGCVSIII